MNARRIPGAGRARLAALLVVAGALAPAALAQTPAVTLNPSLDFTDTKPVDGVPAVTAGELGRLLGATRFWRADLRRLELRVEGHRLVMTVDNPFVLVDDVTVLLPAPVVLREDELHVPADIAAHLPIDTGWPRLLHDPRRRVVLVVPPEGIVEAPAIRHGPDLVRVTFPADTPAGVSVASRARNRFRLRFEGVFSGSLPDTMPAGSLLRGMRAIPAVKGCAFELQIAPEAGGFRIVRDAAQRSVSIELHRSAQAADEAFAPPGPSGPRDLRLIVLDPGHGGADPGVRAENQVEKVLALDLARMLREELVARMPVRVLLTREDDRTLSAEQRAEFANRVRADLVISLHFDGLTQIGAAGATAYCPPASGAADPFDQAGGWTLRAWRDIPLAHAVQSRALAEAVLSALELRGQGPTRLRETLPYPLVGVDAPGILLECATLTAPADRRRILRPDGLRILASTLAEGVEAYQRNP